jgi:phosphohistidine phosphatase
MQVYLVRHAHAVTAEENPERPLSSRGREECRLLVDFFRANRALSVAQLWHSPLVRALETATLLHDGLSLDAALVETPGLLPEDDPHEIAARLSERTFPANLAVVGHEPHLSALATLLVRGKEKPVAFDLKKGAIIALECTDAVHKKTGEPRWRILWHLTPSLLSPNP